MPSGAGVEEAVGGGHVDHWPRNEGRPTVSVSLSEVWPSAAYLARPWGNRQAGTAEFRASRPPGGWLNNTRRG